MPEWCVGRLPGQVSMTMTTSMQRSMIVIPAQGLIEIRDTLTDLLKEFGTDNKGELLWCKLFICPICMCSMSSYHMAEHRPAQSENIQPHTESSSQSGPEPSSVEAELNVCHYAYLVVQAGNEKEDTARQSCAMVPRWRFLTSFLCPVFPASCVQQVSDIHSKFALRTHHVCKYGRHPISGR